MALVHCNQSSTTETYTPITGIQISAEALTAGHGCSDNPDDPNAVYRYSAVVSYLYEGGVAPVPGSQYNQQYANVFECFADGYFENLPVLDGGNQAFTLTVAAWNYSGWNAMGSPARLSPCISEPDGSSLANLCPAEQPLDVLDGGGVPPQWTTTCTAYMQPSIPAVAACGPLVPFAGGAIPAPDAGGDDASTSDGSTGAADGPAPAADATSGE
jgi:hypothetical protein